MLAKKKITFLQLPQHSSLAAFAPTAVGAALATAVVDEFAAAVGAHLVGLGAVFDVALQRAGHTVAPRGDAVGVEVELADELDHVGDMHRQRQQQKQHLPLL